MPARFFRTSTTISMAAHLIWAPTRSVSPRPIMDRGSAVTASNAKVVSKERKDNLMDVVPVIVEVEERFGVTIPDERAWPTTVGELYLYLLGRTCRPAQAPCPTSQAF